MQTEMFKDNSSQLQELERLKKVISKAEKISLIWELLSDTLGIDIKHKAGISLVVKECKAAYDEREKAIEAIDRMMKDQVRLDRLERDLTEYDKAQAEGSGDLDFRMREALESSAERDT